MTVHVEIEGPVQIVAIDRPERRNAVDQATAGELLAAFESFAADDGLRVAVLTGANGTFCAGADLKAISEGGGNRVELDGPGPMGPTRLDLDKPVIAAIEGFAVAGGIELALWCDLRVAASDATLGVYCRRWGVPLVDGGTIRLPRLIGASHANDLILTGRPVDAWEAERMGLVNRVVPVGQARFEAESLARQLAGLPQTCLVHDRLSVLESEGLTEEEALEVEHRHGLVSLTEAVEGAQRFVAGEGRHGRPVEERPI